MNNHDAEHNQDQFLKQAKQSLDMQSDNIDEPTRAALRNIRRQALAQQTLPRRNWFISPSMTPMIGAGAMLAVVASIVLSVMTRPEIDAQPVLEDIPLLTSTDDITFYQNLEFYQWLEAENING